RSRRGCPARGRAWRLIAPNPSRWQQRSGNSIFAEDRQIGGLCRLKRRFGVRRQGDGDDEPVAVLVTVSRRGLQFVALLLEAARLEVMAHESRLAFTLEVV